MVKIDWHPEPKILSRFGKTAPIGFGICGLLIAWKVGAFAGDASWMWPITIWALGAVIFALGFFIPGILRPVYLILCGFGWLFFTTLGLIAMTLIFFLLLTPIALISKVSRRREIDCEMNPNAKSYWQPKDANRTKESYFRQF